MRAFSLEAVCREAVCIHACMPVMCCAQMFLHQFCLNAGPCESSGPTLMLGQAVWHSVVLAPDIIDFVGTSDLPDVDVGLACIIGFSR